MRRILSVATAMFAAVVLMSTAVPSSAQSSNGLGITPRKDIVVEAGKSVTDKLFIGNLNSDRELRLTLQILDFGAKDESGTPALNLDPEAKQTAWSLRPFIKAPESVVVAPGKDQYINFTVDIPAGHGAGSYYSAIRYVTEGAGSGNVAVSASGATLVFVTVPGKTKESLLLQKFGAYQAVKGKDIGNYKTFFSASPPKQLAYTIKNQGNVAEQPAGSIQIKNMFGKQVKIVKDANQKGSLALIGQTRLVDTCISPPSRDNAAQGCQNVSLMPGRYTATLNVFYGINGGSTQEIVGSASFWYLPMWFLIVVLVALAALIITGFVVYRRLTGKSGFKRR